MFGHHNYSGFGDDLKANLGYDTKEIILAGQWSQKS